MRDVFALKPWNVAAFVAVVTLLLIAYVLAPGRLVQYGAWLVIFTIWMAWFVYAGVDYVYGIDS